jgi:hypothetical protein
MFTTHDMTSCLPQTRIDVIERRNIVSGRRLRGSHRHMNYYLLFVRRSVLIAAIAFGCAVVGAAPRGANGQELEAAPAQLEEASGGIPGPIEGPAAEAILHGPLPSDPAELALLKAEAAQEFGITSPEEAANPRPEAVTPTPTILLGKNGLSDSSGSPSDSTGAIGTGRYIELINSKIGIYDLSLNLLKQDTLTSLFAEIGAHNFDPQIIWDPTTNRFYYAGDAVFSTSDNRLALGFSKTATPSNATTDWCHYQLSFGSSFPDFPKLGDSTPFWVLGDNNFNVSGSYVGSDIHAISKPPAGTTCPAASTFKVGTLANIAISGVKFFTPVPANEIDSNATARIVTRQISLPGTKIGLFSVTASATGSPVFPAGSTLTVASYTLPANAPQKGTTFTLDTSDARMTQAVAAIDPAHSLKFAVWTQHAIKGGAGSMVRWYEIDPVGKAVLQSGNQSSASLFLFNAAISPDRVVNGATKAFGSNMLLNFNATSSTVAESIQMVSKRGANSLSLPKVVHVSTGPDTDFTCTPTCRWGDYPAATPDPKSPTTGPAGIIWGTSMWTVPGTLGNPSWRTWNWKSQD